MMANNIEGLWDPHFYSNHSEIQFNIGIELLKHYIFRGDEKVLDIGAGSGELTAYIAKWVPNGQVIGIDLSKAMVEFANKQFFSDPHINFVQASAVNFSFDFQFDLITSFNTLHWVYAQATTLANMYEHLKNGGTILVQMSPQNDNFLEDAVVMTMDDKKWMAYFNNYEPQYYLSETSHLQYKKMLNEIGFKISFFHTNEKEITFANDESFALWLQGWLPQVSVIPKPLKKNFVLQIAEAFRYIKEQHDSEISYSYLSWEIMAKK